MFPPLTEVRKHRKQHTRLDLLVFPMFPHPETGPETQKGWENCLVSTVSHVSTKIDATGSAVAAVATIERRRRKVERELAEHPEQRVAADAADAPLKPEPGAPVIVLLAVRTPGHRVRRTRGAARALGRGAVLPDTLGNCPQHAMSA